MAEDATNGKCVSFSDLKLNDWILKQCKALGLNNSTPVQANCIPAILSGKDCIGCAETGSGKTLAFALPILQKLCEDPYGIFALVLTPTRELAMQIADQFRVFGKPINLKDCLIVGGMDMVTQGLELARNPHIVIATPGRLADHLESCNTFTLKRVQFLVLDEADRLLEGHFNDQLQTIFKALPKKRQTLLFSATITQTLEELKEIALTNPFFWAQKKDITTVEQLDQRYVLAPKHVRDIYMIHIIHKFLEKKPKGSIIVFTNTCRNCQRISMTLRSLGFHSVALHSLASQRERVAALSKFKSNNARVLVATDVASRGLDIPQVELVLNHFIPKSAKDYVHRVGRTARAGRDGLAVTILSQHDINLLHSVEELIKTKLTLYETNEKEVLNIMTQASVALREAEIRMEETDFGEKKAINKRKRLILDGRDPDEEAATKKTKVAKKKQNKKFKKPKKGKLT